MPPLLGTTSTKQFFKDDEIKLNGEDRKRAERRIKEGAVPLMYVRDLSKMSMEKREENAPLKLRGKAALKLK